MQHYLISDSSPVTSPWDGTTCKRTTSCGTTTIRNASYAWQAWAGQPELYRMVCVPALSLYSSCRDVLTSPFSMSRVLAIGGERETEAHWLSDKCWLQLTYSYIEALDKEPVPSTQAL